MLSITLGLAAFKLASGLIATSQRTQPVTQLSNADFAAGTYRILTSGRYELTEPIVFDPTYDSQTMSWSKFPSDSATYQENGGYVFGFFAAVTVEADDVVLDCMGHSLAMSPAFHKMQRYFSLIQLASSPFTTGLQPFHNPNKLPATAANPGNVVIENCELGLTSRSAIHGNSNAGLTLRNLKIYDFEGGGIEILGAASSPVTIEYCEIGPSLTETYSSYLYQAMMADHLLTTLMPQEPVMESLANSTDVMIRGETRTARDWFDALRTALKTFMENSTGPMAAVAGSGTDLPDTAAIYGILMHTEIAHEGTLQDLFCPDNFLCDLRPGVDTPMQNVSLKHLVIKDLGAGVKQRARVAHRKGTLVGPTGEIFPMVENWDVGHCYRYVGNALTDVQVAAGALTAKARKGSSRVAVATVERYLGKAYVSQYVRQWAAHDMPCTESGALVLRLWRGAKKAQIGQNISCEADTYDCRNIGAVGVRLDFVRNVEVVNLTVGNFTNHGQEDAAPWCSSANYNGLEVRGLSTTYVSNLSKFELNQDGSFVSVHGGANHIFPGLTASDPVSIR